MEKIEIKEILLENGYKENEAWKFSKEYDLNKGKSTIKLKRNLLKELDFIPGCAIAKVVMDLDKELFTIDYIYSREKDTYDNLGTITKESLADFEAMVEDIKLDRYYKETALRFEDNYTVIKESENYKMIQIKENYAVASCKLIADGFFILDKNNKNLYPVGKRDVRIFEEIIQEGYDLDNAINNYIDLRMNWKSNLIRRK
jgi:hypothetical protein